MPSLTLFFILTPYVHTAECLSVFVKCISKAVLERNGMIRTGLRAQPTEFLPLSHSSFHVEEVLAAVWRSVAEFFCFSGIGLAGPVHRTRCQQLCEVMSLSSSTSLTHSFSLALFRQP